MKLTPTYMFATYREVTPEFLQQAGIRYLLADIDNTLAPYEQPEPDDALRASRHWMLPESGSRWSPTTTRNGWSASMQPWGSPPTPKAVSPERKPCSAP